MAHLMFDVDGTLVHSLNADTECYLETVKEVTGHSLDTRWELYPHATDLGILRAHLQKHGLESELDKYSKQVKKRFTELLSLRIAEQPIQPVSGAAEFLDVLRRIPHVSLSLATGGWWDTASLKLASADIDVSGLSYASSDDHYSRTEIMEIARSRVGNPPVSQCSYFGDGLWDKAACETLGYNFVLVGNGRFHDQAIADFTNSATALKFADV